jgi:hypothetical protein
MTVRTTLDSAYFMIIRIVFDVEVVMGGVSRSDLEPGQAFTGRWTGFVTSENNGGFAGIRTKLLKTPLDMSSCRGVIIKVKGDGKRYKCILRDDADWNGIAWSFSFDTTAGKTVAIKVPFDELKPTRFARVNKDGKRINRAQIAALQLSLSKFEYDGVLNPRFKEGPFELTIQAITAF